MDKKAALLGLIISINNLSATAEELSHQGVFERSEEDSEFIDLFLDPDEIDITQMPYFSKDHQKSHSRDYSRSF